MATNSLPISSPIQPVRAKLPQTRTGINHRFNIGGHQGYILVNTYPNGQPGEVFIRIAKEGSTLAGMMNTISILTSIALQHGVPLTLLCEKFRDTRFEPAGWSENKDVGYATSIVDYIFHWMELKFTKNPAERQKSLERLRLAVSPSPQLPLQQVQDENAPACTHCGSIMVRAGSCFSCTTCGETSGCG